jgi:hypothetical protein
VNKDQVRIKIAEACGWELKSNGLSPMWSWQNESLTHRIKWVAHKEMASQGVLPDYLNDLNAMAAAESIIIKAGAQTIRLYEDALQKFVANIVFATADHRAEAFLKTLNLWKP